MSAPAGVARLGALLALSLALAAGARAFEGRFIGPGGPGLEVPRAGRAVLVLYMHGARGEDQHDPCVPLGDAGWGLLAVPEALRELAGSEVGGRSIVVYALCDRRAGTTLGAGEEARREMPCRDGTPRWPAGRPQPDVPFLIKTCKRARLLREAAQTFLGANPALAPDRVVLAGGSAGGWAALLAMRFAAHDGQRIAARALAFAPAFAGRRASRGGDWPEARERQLAFLTRAGAGPLPALVFAFHGDPWERPGDLSVLGSTPGVACLAVPEPPREPHRCEGAATAHACARRAWFTGEYRDRIGAFLRAGTLPRAGTYAPCR